MDTKARTNKTLKIMKKIESRQGWNRLLFFVSFGLTCHALACIGSEKKLNTYDYAGIAGCVLAGKRGYTLNKKEEQGQRIWHILQKKSAHQA